jgi:two-component system sensor histidine kinase PilS (NtrC family)
MKPGDREGQAMPGASTAEAVASAEKRLLEENRELERRLREAERLATIGELAARVAHEIRNPLAGIAGAVQVMARDFPKGGRKEVTVREILREVKRLDAFIRDLLVFARPVRPEREPVTLEGLMGRARRVIDDSPAYRHVEVLMEDTHPDEHLQVDAALLVSVLRSLLLNAAQSQARQERGRIEVRRERLPSGAWRVCVYDDGTGFPEDAAERERLFEPFHAGRQRGGGLGLATARKIVEGHGGRIEALNRDDGGGAICIELPR